MAQSQSGEERTQNALPINLLPTDFAVAAKERIESFVNAQSDLWSTLQEASRQWSDRMQQEANVASDLASKLTSVRSMSDAMTAYQDYASRRFEMMVDDTKHVVNDTQKLMQLGARFLTNGWLSKGAGTST